MNDMSYLRNMHKKLNLPEYELKINKTGNAISVFDIIRKKYILLTPEEEVRQRFIHFLINEKKFPKGLMAVEKELKFYELKKRTDIVLYDKNANISVIIECKAPEVNITQKTFDQIARYNMNFKAEYLIVTNGITHYCCKPNYDKKSYNYIKEIQTYEIQMSIFATLLAVLVVCLACCSCLAALNKMKRYYTAAEYTYLGPKPMRESEMI